MRDEVMYRCVNMSCARLLPRRVNYCPYCGIEQGTGLLPPVHGAAEATVVPAAPEPSRAAVVAAAPAVSFVKAPVEQGSPAPPGIAAVPPVPAAPPRPRPIQLRWWVVALAALWLIWVSQRPPTAKLDARVDKAVALAVACKANEAQAELIALKDTAATAGQLARLQAALNDADVSCRRPGRGRAAVKPPVRAAAQSVRNLVGDARADLARGDYRGAADKMEVCVAMVDANSKECAELKARAEKLDAEMRRCLAKNGEWISDRCQ